MFDFLTAGKIKGLLGSYPITLLPHRGQFAKLNPEEADANLAWFEAHKAQRIASAARVLSAFDIAVATGADDIENFSKRLDAFFKRELVKYPGFAKSLGPNWEEQHFANPNPGICFLVDISVLLGEMVVAHSPVFRWDIDRDPWRKRAKAATVGRIVLFADGDKERKSAAVVLDVDRWVVSALSESCRMRDAPSLQRTNMFLFLPQIFEGRYDPI